MSQVSEFAGEHGVSTNALKNVVKSLLGFFKSALKSNLTPAQVKEDLEHLGKILENLVGGMGRGSLRGGGGGGGYPPFALGGGGGGVWGLGVVVGGGVWVVGCGVSLFCLCG